MPLCISYKSQTSLIHDSSKRTFVHKLIGLPAYSPLGCLLVDHPRSDVVYNFGRVCLSVCQPITFESLYVGNSYLHIRYISRKYGVKFIYEGYRVKVKVTGARNVEDSFPIPAV